MHQRLPILAALALVSATATTAEAGDVRFRFGGTVISASNPNGAYAGVQVNDAVELSCEVFTTNPPPTVVAPGQLVQYAVDTSTLSMTIGSVTVGFESGSPVLAVQNNFPASDGIGRNPDLTATMGGKTQTFGFGHNGSLLTSTDPLENLGTTAITPDGFFSFTWTVTGGGSFIEMFPETMTIELVEVGTPFCAGDGAGRACPCANESTPGDGAGCLHSFGQGGKLRAYGDALLGADTLMLVGTQLPDSPALYFQGTAQQAGGLGDPFGDGLRCVGGTVQRLGTKTSVGGTSQYPEAGDAPISTMGAIGVPGTRHYQVWFRNVAPFCTQAGFNLTNGLTVDWN